VTPCAPSFAAGTVDNAAGAGANAVHRFTPQPGTAAGGAGTGYAPFVKQAPASTATYQPGGPAGGAARRVPVTTTTSTY
jgi:hypothetical protein